MTSVISDLHCECHCSYTLYLMFARLLWRSSALFGERKKNKNIANRACEVTWPVCSAACDTLPVSQESDAEQGI